MTPLRTKMITDMQLHRLAPGTQALYLRDSRLVVIMAAPRIN